MTARVLAERHLPAADDLFLAGMRRWVASSMHGCTRGAIQEACIVLAELLGNAYRHADAPYGVRLELPAEGKVVVLRVDDSTAAPAEPWPVGKGLLIVRGLCPQWGVETRPPGKAVWAHLPVLVTPVP
ncbi:ATP-binding protein [Actinophytocola gossypii]|uniref:ATP-binding protein n=1 Tax=Actinophytocola gossypii TaxID=2812003 RepID=A0ABT2J756_9PSEU|nr:ATP-binding protein [Actinophytocola gossypii]MCT2583686.1 ATP-binding protein [Actinophytocola gossypii]